MLMGAFLIIRNDTSYIISFKNSRKLLQTTDIGEKFFKTAIEAYSELRKASKRPVTIFNGL